MIVAPAVIDTNVVVAGLLSSHPEAGCAQVLDAMTSGRFLFLISTELLAEYREVLLRPRITARHGLTEAEIDGILVRLAANALVREPVPIDERAPDPGDNHLWALLAAENGAFLVTGDARLQQRPPSFASVLSAGEFVQSLSS